jgi:hypothetical protein
MLQQAKSTAMGYFFSLLSRFKARPVAQGAAVPTRGCLYKMLLQDTFS